MFNLYRVSFVLVLAAAAALVVDLNSASAQRRQFIGKSDSNSSSGNNQSNNQSNNNKDEDKDKNGSNNSNSTNSNSSNTKTTQQGVSFQQMGQGSGSGQNGQTIRGLRIGNGQGQGQNQGQNLQSQNVQQWQMWQGQGQGQNQNLRGNGRGNQQNNQKKNSNWFIQIGGGPAPFTVSWYDKHPQAWKWKHNDNDAWKAVTAATVIGFLGWGQPYYYNPQVIYQPQPVIVFDPDAIGPWMPLGVYSLLTGPADTGTRMLQISINPQGYIRGSYYDMITNEAYNMRGRIDQATQYVQWSLDTNHALSFYTPLHQLTQSQGIVNVQLPGGTQQWQVVRMEYAQ